MDIVITKTSTKENERLRLFLEKGLHLKPQIVESKWMSVTFEILDVEYTRRSERMAILRRQKATNHA